MPCIIPNMIKLNLLQKKTSGRKSIFFFKVPKFYKTHLKFIARIGVTGLVTGLSSNVN